MFLLLHNTKNRNQYKPVNKEMIGWGGGSLDERGNMKSLQRDGLARVKADMKSYKSLETAAIFYSSEPFLKQGIS